MISPHPPRLRMKRRKTVSVTPAIGARTVAGAIVTLPMERLAATGRNTEASVQHEDVRLELSQDLRTLLFYLLVATQPGPVADRAGTMFSTGATNFLPR